MNEENICRSYKYALRSENFLSNLGGEKCWDVETEDTKSKYWWVFFPHFKIVCYPYLIIYLIWSELKKKTGKNTEDALLRKLCLLVEILHKVIHLDIRVWTFQNPLFIHKMCVVEHFYRGKPITFIILSGRPVIQRRLWSTCLCDVMCDQQTIPKESGCFTSLGLTTTWRTKAGVQWSENHIIRFFWWQQTVGIYQLCVIPCNLN